MINIESILKNSGVDVGWIEDFDNDDMVQFKTSSGKYSSGVFTLKPEDAGKSNSKNIPKDEARTKLINGLNNEKKNTAQYFKVKENGGDASLITTATNNDTVTFNLNITYTDIAEGDLNSITFKFIAEKGEAKWN